MRKALLMVAGLVLLGGAAARADTIKEYGLILGATQSNEYGYIITYSFAPVIIPGRLINFTLDFEGTIFASIGGAFGVTGGPVNYIDSVNILPTAQFFTSQLSGPTIDVLPTSTQLGQVNTPYDNTANKSVPVQRNISLVGNSYPSATADVLATTNKAAVVLFASPGNPFVIEPIGSTAGFSGAAETDRSTGLGTLLLTVNYTPVPEPTSLTLLGVGLAGVVAARRRRG